MGKLVARGGKINDESKFTAGVMNVLFRRAAIAVSGDIGEVVVQVGSDQIEMTFSQALSLAQEIMRRCQ